MKTYSVTHNPLQKEKSKHNLPDNMVIKFDTPDKRILRVEDNSRRYAETKYGFSITDEELSKYTPLYRSLGYNSYEEVYVVDTTSVYDTDKKNLRYILSTDNWTFVFRTKVKYYSNEESTFLEIQRHIPKSPQKLFLNVDEMVEHYKKEEAKRQEKNNAEAAKVQATNNGPLVMQTPVKTIKFINKPTDFIPNAKVGDTIYGTLTIIDKNGKSSLSTQSVYVNYISVYLNNKKINTLPMSTFGLVMSKNFVLE